MDEIQRAWQRNQLCNSGWGAGGGHVPPQRREKMGAPKAPSVLRGRQMPESLIHTNAIEKSMRNSFASTKDFWPLKMF